METPNDSSSATAEGGATAAAEGLREAAGVTPVAVRCSAWLGVVVVEGNRCKSEFIAMGGQLPVVAVAGLPPQGQRHHPVLEL